MKQPVKKAKPAGHPKPPPAWHPVSVAAQRKRHRAAVKAAHTRVKTAPSGSGSGGGASPGGGKQPVKKQPAKKPVKRKLALGSAVACCSAEALAASLRLSGWPVSDADVLALYLRTTRDLDAGAPILATLEAAAEFGLSGTRPLSFREVMPGDHSTQPERVSAGRAGLILGLALPAPHAVLDTGAEWISWGQPWPVSAFPDAVLEEAWTVEWEAYA